MSTLPARILAALGAFVLNLALFGALFVIWLQHACS